MKCQACDVILTDREAVHKDQYGNYPDMCFRCLGFTEDIDQFLIETPLPVVDSYEE